LLNVFLLFWAAQSYADEYLVQCTTLNSAYIGDVSKEANEYTISITLDLVFDENGELRQFNSDWFNCDKNVNLTSDEKSIRLTCESGGSFGSKIEYDVNRLTAKFKIIETYDNGNMLVVNGGCEKLESKTF